MDAERRASAIAAVDAILSEYSTFHCEEEMRKALSEEIVAAVLVVIELE